MVSLNPPNVATKRKIAKAPPRQNPNRSTQPPQRVRTTSDAQPRIESIALPGTVPFDESVHVLERLSWVTRNLVVAGAQPAVYGFKEEHIRDRNLLHCPDSGLVLPPRDSIPPLEDEEPSPDENKKEPRKRRKTLKIPDEEEEDRVPRSPNAFILWRSDILHRKPGLADKNLTAARIARMWNAEIPDHVKQHYQSLSEAAKKWHKEQHPDYKYCPKSAAEKAALKAIRNEKKAAAKEAERVAKEAAKLAKKRGRRYSAPRMEGPSTSMAVDGQYQGHSAAAYGREGPSPGWTPEGGASTLVDDDEDEYEYADSMATPMPSRPPSPPPRNRRPRASLPTRETFDFTCPPNPWPTLGGSVAWSKAAPPPGPSNYHQQQPQPHPGNNPQWTAPATAAGPSSAQHQPQGYQEWPAQGGHYRPEIMLSLPSTVVNEGLGLPGADTGLPTVLNNLDIGGPPSHQMYNVHPQPHSVGYETVHYAAPAAAPQAPTLHAAPQTMLDPQHVQLSLADARSTMNVLSHTIEYAASGGAVVEPQHVAGGHSDFSEGVWGDMFNQEFAAFPSVLIPSVNSMDFAITDMSDVQLNFDQFAQSAMFDQPGAASNGGMAMEDESGDAMLADQFGLDLASQVVHDNWPAQTQQPAGNSGFHPGIFTAKGQINFAAPASAVPSPTEATSYYSPAAISPNGGFDAGEPSPPPYEPGPAEGAGRYLPPTSKPDAYYVAPASRPVEDPRTLDPNLLSYGAQGSTKAPLLAPARLRVYAAPPPSGVLERKAPVDAIPDGPPEIPRASKPVLKHLPGASGAGGGRRVTSISATLPPVPNLTSSH